MNDGGSDQGYSCPGEEGVGGGGEEEGFKRYLGSKVSKTW